MVFCITCQGIDKLVWGPVVWKIWETFPEPLFINSSSPSAAYIKGILPKGPYLPCVSMVGRALLAGYPRYASVNMVSIGSDNGLSPIRHQAIIKTNAGLLSIGTFSNKLQWNLSQNSIIFIHEKAFENAICQDGGHFVQGGRWVK